MKDRKKRWLSAALAVTMVASALPLEAAAFSFSDFFGGWTPPSRDELEQAAKTAEEIPQAEQLLKTLLGDLYASYKKLEQVDFTQIPVELKVKAVWPEDSEELPTEVEAIVSDGVNNYPLKLTAENQWSGSVLVPLFQGKLDVKLNGESEFPQVIDYDVTAASAEGFETPAVQDFQLDFQWTQVEENWTPQAEAVLTYCHPQEETRFYSVITEWQDEEGAWFLRPNIQVQLLANGQQAQEPVTLSAFNAWGHTWQELPKSDEQGKINYSVEVLDFSHENYELTLERTDEMAKLIMQQESVFSVPLDVVVLWEHGENDNPPNVQSLQIGGKTVTLSGDEEEALWYFPKQSQLPLLENGFVANHSNAVSADEIEQYNSRVLTLPYYGEELTYAELSAWLEALDGEIPQLLSESEGLRWISVVWNEYEAPIVEEPQEPILEVDVDVLTLWNDEGMEQNRPDSITYNLIGKDGLVKNSKSVAVNKTNHLSYEAALFRVSGSEAELSELQLTEAFMEMHRYDRSLYLLKVPAVGFDLSAVSALNPQQLVLWAQQWSAAAPSDEYKLLAVVINSRQGSGSLTVKKDVVDYDGNPLKDNSAFTYQISLIYPDLTTDLQTVKISEEAPLLLEDLPVGTRYSVLETGRYGYINDDSDCLQSGVIQEGSNQLTFVNRKFNLIVRVDWSDWYRDHDSVRIYVDDNRYNLDEDCLWMDIDYAHGISELSYRDIQARGIPEEYDVTYSISWRQHVAIVTVTAEYDKDYEVEDNWDDWEESDGYRVLAKVV